MARDVFPHEADRRMIGAFLRGVGRNAGMVSAGLTSALAISHDRLILNGDGKDLTIAWIAESDRALYAKLLDGPHYHASVQVIHEILRQLGLPEIRVVREDHGFEGSVRKFSYFIDDKPTGLDLPMLITGPIGLAAYRAAPAGVPTP